MLDNLRQARVVAYHARSHTADIIQLDNGARYPRVPIMTPAASTDSGLTEMSAPDPLGEENGAGREQGRVLIAVIGFMMRSPVIIGFLPPFYSQMLFSSGRYVHRLPSDVYITGDQDGNVELYHPSGTFLRIGESPAHEDLTAQDANRRWKIERNTDKAPAVRLVVANGGAAKATLTISSDGNVSIVTEGDISAQAASATLDTPSTTITGDVAIQGKLDVNGAIKSTTSVEDPNGTMQEMRDTYNSHVHANPEGGSVGPVSASMS